MKTESFLVECHVLRLVKGLPQFLLLKRSSEKYFGGFWQMVTGKIKNNETGYNAALRELEEETGLKASELYVAPHINSFYAPERDSISLIPVFLAVVEANSIVALSEEHSEFRWVTSNEAVELLAWEDQKKSVKIIEDYYLNKKEILVHNKIDIN